MLPGQAPSVLNMGLAPISHVRIEFLYSNIHFTLQKYHLHVAYTLELQVSFTKASFEDHSFYQVESNFIKFTISANA